jgi:hypothetical protein
VAAIATLKRRFRMEALLCPRAMTIDRLISGQRNFRCVIEFGALAALPHHFAPRSWFSTPASGDAGTWQASALVKEDLRMFTSPSCAPLERLERAASVPRASIERIRASTGAFANVAFAAGSMVDVARCS